jgi:hypothetical protein
METQELVSFVLFSSGKIFRTSVDNTNVLRSSNKSSNFSDFNQTWSFLTEVPNIKSDINPFDGSDADIWG